MNYEESEILSVAERYLGRLQRSGSENVMAICPFHTKAGGAPERSPSFALSVTTGLWFCHSCKEAGNLRMLLKAFDVSSAAIENRYGRLIENLNAHARVTKTKPNRIVLDQGPPLEEGILGFFEGIPLALEDEGFTEETIRHFDVGYDERNMRITFPLRDMLGRLIGISGRAVGECQGPRYKVYAEREYEAWGIPPRHTDKSSLLWNMHRVYPATLFESHTMVVLVEGFKACMWLYQAGVKNVVAMVGSHLSYQQRLLLERIGATVYVFTDNDEAGDVARRRISKELTNALHVRVVEYDGHQPTNLDPVSLLAALEASVDYGRWVMRKGTSS